MSVIDVALLIALGAFLITIAVDSIKKFLAKNKEKKLEKEKKDGSDSN